MKACPDVVQAGCPACNTKCLTTSQLEEKTIQACLMFILGFIAEEQHSSFKKEQPSTRWVFVELKV
jgi:hypothetical protein